MGNDADGLPLFLSHSLTCNNQVPATGSSRAFRGVLPGAAQQEGHLAVQAADGDVLVPEPLLLALQGGREELQREVEPPLCLVRLGQLPVGDGPGQPPRPER